MLKRVPLLIAVFIFPILAACISAPGAALDDISYDQDGNREILPDSYEPDSRNNPVRVKQGEWISRTLHKNDADWFVFTPGSAGLLVAETAGETDTVLELFMGTTLLRENDDLGKDINARIEYFVESGVTYIIKAAGVRLAGADENDSGPYRFWVDLEPMPLDKTEPNNTLEQAAAIRLGDLITGYFLTPEDIDWYTVPIPGPGYLTVNTEGTLDLLLEVYDQWEELIAKDDDSGFQGNAKIVTNVISAGSVYIKVNAYQGATGRYYLRTQFKDPVRPDSYENDNSLARAKDIQPGSSQERNFIDASDVDWVRLRITHQGSYDIGAIAADNYLDTYIELFDADGELIDKDDDSGGYWNALLSISLNPGIYYIKVSTVDKDPLENNDYTLSVSSGN